MVVGATATQTFKPECTLPPPGTNFVSGPNTRSTLGILWNCLSIIILCTWTIQHLNIPVIRGDPRSIFQRWWWNILDASVKLKWMTLTILVPEYLLGRAMVELLVARSMKTFTGNRFKMDTLTAYMANMGYFVLDVGGIPERAVKVEGNPNDEFLAREYRHMKAYVINYNRLRHRYWALNARQLETAVGWGMVQLPPIPRSQLEKLDKGGALVKLLALVQVVYLVIQLSVRKAAGLPSSQLEIASLAFAVSSGITYLLYWIRPQGIETIMLLKPNPRDGAPEAAESRKHVWYNPRYPLDHFRRVLAANGPSYNWFWRRDLDSVKPKYGPVPIPNDASHVSPNFLTTSKIHTLLGDNEEAGSLAVGAIAGGVVFGGLHCLAWNFQFPTAAEATLWRVSSVVTTCIPVLAVVPMVFWARLNPAQGILIAGENQRRRVLGPLIIVLLVIPYVLARVIIMVEIFRTLCYLPPEVYIETWSGSFPHWT